VRALSERTAAWRRGRARLCARIHQAQRRRLGEATLVRAGDDAALVPGVLFEVARADLARLDAAEGVGFGYDRDDAFAVARAANDVEAVVSTYIAPAHACDRSLVAYDWYLALVLAGARLHGLPPAHIEALGRVAVRPDPDDRRPTRREALELLRRAGLRRADPRLTPGRRGFDPSLANRSVTSRRPDATLNAGSRTRAAT
jgi:hypothetical protein